jgi:hypothetical protein
MSSLRKTLGSIFLAAFFLALAIIAMIFYNADKQQQEEMVNTDLVQKSKAALITVVDTTGKVVTAQPTRNPVLEDKMTAVVKSINLLDLLNKLGTSTADVADSSEKVPGFWDRIVTFFKDEWAGSQTVAPETVPTDQIVQPTGAANSLNQSLVDYVKTDTGAEIIFRSKTGEEYKLPLPFKFLSNN